MDDFMPPEEPHMTAEERKAALEWWKTEETPFDHWGRWGLWSARIGSFLEGYRAGKKAGKHRSVRCTACGQRVSSARGIKRKRKKT